MNLKKLMQINDSLGLLILRVVTAFVNLACSTEKVMVEEVL